MNGDGAQQLPQASEPLTLQQMVEMFLQKDYFDRVLEEKDKKVEADRVGLENRLNETKVTTDRALQEAKAATKQELDNAKTAADREQKVIQDRLAKLESGGAPFANRLDEGVTKLRADVDTLNVTAVRMDGEEHRRLKHDVEVLNVDAVKTKVLDALREQTATDAVTQKRSVRIALMTAGFAATLAGVQFIVNLLSNKP